MESLSQEQHRPLDFLASGWATRIGQEFSKPYLDDLRSFLRSEYRSHQTVFPPKDKIFRALKMVDFDQVKVLILGQDPYHGQNQANGFAFAVERNIPPPPSLVNIFKEVAADLQCSPPKSPTLEGWAAQGVLMLNTVLTVRAAQAFSHRGRGWETFTQRVIEELGRREAPVVFMLWGAPAQQKATYITGTHHLILRAPHPSPLSAHRGFFGCRHFSKANEFLSRTSSPIDWTRT